MRSRGGRIFAYVLKVDSGFAPNPFHGWCSLACCKPAIRRKARPGDWILGVTPRALGSRVAYAMRVEESLTFDEYWADARFRAKRPPGRRGAPTVEKCGDACYQPTANGEFRQLPWSGHWDRENGRENTRLKAKDLHGERVLVARRFCYLGAHALPFPEHLSFQLPARYNRVNFTDQEKAALLRFLDGLPRGIRGQPRDWPEGDVSWRQRRARCG